jgi:hypothetical protein
VSAFVTEAEAAQILGTTPPKRSKIGETEVEFDGHRFDSKLECRLYVELRARARAGEIEGLVVHPVFDLVVNGQLVAKFIPDFSFYEKGPAGEPRRRILDAKGVRKGSTFAAFQIKRKLFAALNPGLTVELWPLEHPRPRRKK